MKRALLACAFVLTTVPLYGAEAKPGKLHVVDDCKKEINAAVNDMVEIRISNPALPVQVHDLDVQANPAAVLAGVVNTTNGLPGGDRISIFVGLISGNRSGTVVYSYKDGDEKVHKCKLIIQVTKP